MLDFFLMLIYLLTLPRIYIVSYIFSHFCYFVALERNTFDIHSKEGVQNATSRRLHARAHQPASKQCKIKF